mgnify:FL=1
MCREFFVSGRVQGVFFRASTRDVAIPLGIGGYAINLPDGRVEVRACGDPTAVDQLAAWLRDGPAQASVTSVEERATPCTKPDGFRTG